jgi:hypothetical protein
VLPHLVFGAVAAALGIIVVLRKMNVKRQSWAAMPMSRSGGSALDHTFQTKPKCRSAGILHQAGCQHTVSSRMAPVSVPTRSRAFTSAV